MTKPKVKFDPKQIIAQQKEAEVKEAGKSLAVKPVVKTAPAKKTASKHIVKPVHKTASKPPAKTQITVSKTTATPAKVLAKVAPKAPEAKPETPKVKKTTIITMSDLLNQMQKSIAKASTV